MNIKLPHWQHAALSMLILCVLVVLFYFVLIRPVLSMKSENIERIDDLSFQLNRFANAKSQIEKLENELDVLKQKDINKSHFLEGNSPQIVAADLQKKIKNIIESSGGNLVSTHAITDQDDDIYSKVTLKVHMQVDMKALQAIFHNLTINKPLLFTDNILIQRRNISAKRKNKNSGLLEVRLDVSGYLSQVRT